MSIRSARAALAVLILACASPSFRAGAASLLRLDGDGRIVTVYDGGEIPDFLRTDDCGRYAYEQRFSGTTYLRGGKVFYPPRAGGTEDDIRILRRNGVCLLRLKRESMMADRTLPVTIYQIDKLGRGTNELRAGANHRAMDNGKYTLKDGTTFTVKNNAVVSIR